MNSPYQPVTSLNFESNQQSHLDDRMRTTFCVNASSVIERVDEQLLPSLYNFVGASFGASPSQLGNLTLARAFCQAIASPIAGVLGQYYNRITIICFGATLWGAMSLCFSQSTSVSQGILFWAFNGVGLSFLIPSAQSLTADYNSETHRGAGFGYLHFFGAIGGLTGALFATNMGHLHPFGMQGWRFAFIIVALVSWFIAILAYIFAVDPRYSTDVRYKIDSAGEAEPIGESRVKTVLANIWSVVSIPSFGIIILQGIVGSTPWSALVFLTLYFQLLGASDVTASLLLTVFLAANATGGLLGGYLGDIAAQKSPNHGRILVCQFSVGTGVPLSLVLFKIMPMTMNPMSIIGYGTLLVVMGLLHTWAATACNNPILAEIVPSHMRNLIFAFDRSFEGALAAAGAPIVGILSERAFNFTGTATVGDNVQENLRNARSLGTALALMTSIPWAACAIFFTGLHWTYARDRDDAKKLAARMHDAVARENEERQRLELADL